MLSTYPILINNVAIPFPDRWEESPKKIVNNFETEAGGRNVLVVRNKRLTCSGEWTVTSRWLMKFKQYRTQNSLSVSVYDCEFEQYKTHTMSINEDSFNYSLIKDSQHVGNTNGLYKLSFDLEEF